jgi:hypothetical protein
MASAIVHRINKIASMVALCAIIIAVTAFDLGMTQRTPNARAAVDRQLNKESAQESRVTCERWGKRAGTEDYTACIADVREVQARHDKRRASDSGNRRDGLTLVF